MIILDSVIQLLQSNGGVSVYFSNIASSLKKNNVLFENISFLEGDRKLTPRLFERYRDCVVSRKNGVFHSSYYRLPSEKEMKVITTVHDFTYEKFVRGPAQWVHSWQKNRAIRHSDIVICVSHNTARDLMTYCPIEPSRIRVVHNGVSIAYHPIQDLANAHHQIVLFVGARGGYKNFRLAVEAVSAVPGLILHVVGGGEFTSSERQLLEKYLPARYKWLGRLSDKELNEAYNKAYALLYPSSYEGFGIPIIEAMRAGCPVIAVNTSSIPEVAGNAALLVDRPSATEFSQALQEIPDRRQQLVMAGFEQAAKFSWERCFQETLAIYKELI